MNKVNCLEKCVNEFQEGFADLRIKKIKKVAINQQRRSHKKNKKLGPCFLSRTQLLKVAVYLLAECWRCEVLTTYKRAFQETL